MSSVCDSCLRSGYLLGHLAPAIAGLLGQVRGAAAATLLGLPDEQLIAVAAKGREPAAMAFLERFDVSRAHTRLKTSDVRAFCAHGDSYPPRLLDLIDPPRVLFVTGRGRERMLLGRGEAVAIVGSRAASAHGREVARELGRGLAKAGVGVVSGLALGIDAEAHRGALEGGGVPLAVLACGPDVAYPKTNRALHSRVTERGLIVSELPPGQRPFRWSFPARNRIMAALSEMTVVVEAAQRSGSLITTEFAQELNRAVAAVPGPVTFSGTRGSNALLRDGAGVVTCARDVLEELYDVSVADALIGAAAQVEVCDPDRALLAAVEAGLDMDEICAAAGLPAHEVRAGLARLELDGLLRRAALGGYARTAVQARPACGADYDHPDVTPHHGSALDRGV